ncbi:MAG: aminoacyl-histidine dipeptidase, partial [Lachnospiraceae bacterium]|nr:aminoacyl-histidine dipeptidase [Lachnospiraceae bacterium]
MKTTLDYFREICEIPHGSYNIDSISDYLVDFAKARNLFYIQDDLKNVIIKKPASEGYENEPGIILQGHMDMVAVKTADCKKDLA